ncbi:hypothetical protein LIA77_04135 [Sarocladium implicatum]|nr:hypothetical protein LIA77_04135 [Sarocladium implicatum]
MEGPEMVTVSHATSLSPNTHLKGRGFPIMGEKLGTKSGHDQSTLYLHVDPPPPLAPSPCDFDTGCGWVVAYAVQRERAFVTVSADRGYVGDRHVNACTMIANATVGMVLGLMHLLSTRDLRHNSTPHGNLHRDIVWHNLPTSPSSKTPVVISHSQTFEVAREILASPVRRPEPHVEKRGDCHLAFLKRARQGGAFTLVTICPQQSTALRPG